GCVDWTERRQHLAGVAGAKLCAAFLDRGWVTRIGSRRAVRVTPTGRTALRDLVGLTDLD
ncbi:transcriptional regulator, partial [Micromonospora zhanjiangensis]